MIIIGSKGYPSKIGKNIASTSRKFNFCRVFMFPTRVDETLKRHQNGFV